MRVHPADLARLGLADGDVVRLGRASSSPPAASRGPGVVVVEGLWPSAAFRGGIGINALTSADPGLPNGGAVYHDTAVWLRPI